MSLHLISQLFDCQDFRNYNLFDHFLFFFCLWLGFHDLGSLLLFSALLAFAVKLFLSVFLFLVFFFLIFSLISLGLLLLYKRRGDCIPVISPAVTAFS